MTARRNMAAAVVLVACYLLSGCQKKSEVDRGRIDNGVYSNSTFQFEITPPADWYVMSQDELKAILQQGGDMMTSQNENLKGLNETAQKTTIPLLGVTKVPLGTPTDDNPNLMMVAERIGHAPGIKSGQDYLYHAKKNLQLSGLNIQFTDEPSVQMAGHEFAVLGVTMNLGPEASVNQRMYATVVGDSALTINLTYLTEEGKAELDEFLGTMKAKSAAPSN